MVAPTEKLVIIWSGSELFMSLSRLTEVHLAVFFSSSSPVVLFDNPRMSQYVGSVESSSLVHYRLCICDLFVARNDSWMRWKTSTGTEQIYVFTTVEAEGEAWDPIKLACPPPHTLLLPSLQ